MPRKLASRFSSALFILVLSAASSPATEPAAKKLQAEARSDMERDFRQRLIAVLDRWILVEKALLQGKTEDASNFIKSISELKKSGHKEYEVED